LGDSPTRYLTAARRILIGMHDDQSASHPEGPPQVPDGESLPSEPVPAEPDDSHEDAPQSRESEGETPLDGVYEPL
jgi:hypothetical protein